MGECLLSVFVRTCSLPTYLVQWRFLWVRVEAGLFTGSDELQAVICRQAKHAVPKTKENNGNNVAEEKLSIKLAINPFTPESDQCQNSPAAWQEIWHHTVWRPWLFIAYSDEKWLYYNSSLHHSYNRFLKGWENTLFELRSERVNLWSCFSFHLSNFGFGETITIKQDIQVSATFLAAPSDKKRRPSETRREIRLGSQATATLDKPCLAKPRLWNTKQ